MEIDYLGVEDLESEPTIEEIDANNPYKHQNIVQFAGPRLTHLNLSGLHLDLSDGTSQLISTLRTFAVDTTVTISDLLADFCEAKPDGQQDPFPPLHLTSLHLGQGVFLWKGSSDKLALLTDPAYLEEVYLENSNMYDEEAVMFLGDHGDGINSGLDFEFFDGERCPRLRRFNAYQWRGDVGRWLAGLEKGSRENLEVVFEDKTWLDEEEDDGDDAEWLDGLEEGDKEDCQSSGLGCPFS